MIEVLQSKAVIAIATLIALLVLERIFPMARFIGGLRRVGRNLGLSGLNAILSWLIVVPLTAAAASHALEWRPLWWAGWPGLVVDVLILDLWIYWWHRANHMLPLLWRFHEIHHLDNFLDASSGLRFHFAEVLLSSVVRAVVILLLGVPLASVVVFETLVAIFAMFQHSNLRLPASFERVLSWFIVTPSIHWVHHHAMPPRYRLELFLLALRLGPCVCKPQPHGAHRRNAHWSGRECRQDPAGSGQAALRAVMRKPLFGPNHLV